MTIFTFILALLTPNSSTVVSFMIQNKQNVWLAYKQCSYFPKLELSALDGWKLCEN